MKTRTRTGSRSTALQPLAWASPFPESRPPARARRPRIPGFPAPTPAGALLTHLPFISFLRLHLKH